jgi:hypothetical protein
MYVHSHPIFGLPHLSWLCRINRQMDVVETALRHQPKLSEEAPVRC